MVAHPASRHYGGAQHVRYRPGVFCRNRRGDFMARISLIEEAEHPELAELIARIKAGRRGGLLNVYKLLLHSPALAQTWFDHNGAVRWKTLLTGRLREIVIIRVAHLNGVDYVLA